MEPDLKLDEIASRGHRFWNSDGLPELTMGLMWIVWGASFLIPTVLPESWRSTYWVMALVVLAISGFGTNWVTKKLKQRWTFPHAGFVEFKEPEPWVKVATIVLAALFSIGMLAIARRAEPAELANFGAPVMGLLFCIAYVIFSIWLRMRHYLWLALLSLAAGSALYPLHLGLAGFNWLLIVLGLGTAAFGLARLRAFIRHNLALQKARDE
jgi:hypothetical protein